MSLVERKAFLPTTSTTVYVSTSFDTPKVPKHPTHVRALLLLSGWLMEPVLRPDGMPSTKVTYYIQTEVGGFLPSSVVKRYLAKRALAVVNVEAYLRRFGPPKEDALLQGRRNTLVSVVSSEGESGGRGSLAYFGAPNQQQQ